MDSALNGFEALLFALIFSFAVYGVARACSAVADWWRRRR
jgi:hypothetical protein